MIVGTLNGDTAGAILVWIVVAILGVWSLADRIRRHRREAAMRYRWVCRDCGVGVRGTDPGVVASFIGRHRQTHQDAER